MYFASSLSESIWFTFELTDTWFHSLPVCINVVIEWIFVKFNWSLEKGTHLLRLMSIDINWLWLLIYLSPPFSREIDNKRTRDVTHFRVTSTDTDMRRRRDRHLNLTFCKGWQGLSWRISRASVSSSKISFTNVFRLSRVVYGFQFANHTRLGVGLTLVNSTEVGESELTFSRSVSFCERNSQSAWQWITSRETSSSTIEPVALFSDSWIAV